MDRKKRIIVCGLALALLSFSLRGEDSTVNGNSPEFAQDQPHTLFERLGLFIPSGYKGELRAGYRFSRAAQKENGVSLNFRGARTVDSHAVELTGYYDYARIRNEDDEVSKLVDRYGAASAYEFTVSSPYFLRAETEYSVNRIKGIERQVDLTGLFGARVIDRPKMILSLAVGPGAQNQKLRGESSDWDSQAVFQQKMERQVNSLLRFEQEYTATADAEDFQDHSYNFSALVRVKVSQWADALLRYSNDYTSRVAEDSPRREEHLVLELSIPF